MLFGELNFSDVLPLFVVQLQYTIGKFNKKCMAKAVLFDLFRFDRETEVSPVFF